MHEFSSTVSYSPSFSYYASGEFAAAVKVDSVSDEDADFEFETTPLHEETLVHFPTFTITTDDVVSIINKEEDDAEDISESVSGNCLWSPKRCRLKKFLTRSHSDGVMLAPSASKRCYFKDLMRRSHSDGADATKTISRTVKEKEITASYKVGEGVNRRKSYLPYRPDLIGVFAGIRRLRR